MINKWILANEIHRAMKTQNIEVDEYLPHFIEPIITYHIDENKKSREECGWCADLDETKPDNWYDGFMCPTCGYVRGMNKTTTLVDRLDLSQDEIEDGREREYKVIWSSVRKCGACGDRMFKVTDNGKWECRSNLYMEGGC